MDSDLSPTNRMGKTVSTEMDEGTFGIFKRYKRKTSLVLSLKLLLLLFCPQVGLLCCRNWTALTWSGFGCFASMTVCVLVLCTILPNGDIRCCYCVHLSRFLLSLFHQSYFLQQPLGFSGLTCPIYLFQLSFLCSLCFYYHNCYSKYTTPDYKPAGVFCQLSHRIFLFLCFRSEHLKVILRTKKKKKNSGWLCRVFPVVRNKLCRVWLLPFHLLVVIITQIPFKGC